jgi:hypothetical protein
MSAPILQGLVGIFGTLLGALIAWRVTVGASRWSRTLDFHREFNSPEMGKYRIDAWEYVRHRRGMTFEQIDDDPDSSKHSLYAVMRFYQRLALVTKYNQIARRVVPDMFGELMVWWYVVSFQPMLMPTKWKVCDDIKWLYDWMEKQAGSDNPSSSWAKWHDSAANDLQRFSATIAPAVINALNK